MMGEQSFTDTILRRALDVESAGSGVARKELIAALEAAGRRLTRKIAAMEGESFTKSRYRRIQAEIAGVLAQLGKKYEDILDAARLEVLQSEYDLFHRELATEAGREVRKIAYRLPAQEAAAMLEAPVGGQFLGDWIDAHIGDLKTGIRRELTQSLILGETNREAARRLAEVFALSRNGADLIARSALIHAANVARDAVFERNTDVIAAYKVVATLDARTCFVCASYDGLTASRRDDLPRFPVHPRCRCQVIPITKFENEDEATRAAVFEQEEHRVHHTKVENGKRVPDGTTSTKWKVVKAGQISAKRTFRDFFERQPEQWKRRYLGAARYDLYKAGKLDFADLARNNRVLTLEELKG